METNHELELARQFVEQTDVNVLLLGKAGTGKTTFLHSIVKNGAKRAVVLAPTGVAAINAGGSTIHSFFQLPLAPYIPGTTFRANDKKQFRINRVKLKIIRSLDLLIIDEISMVRADVLDAVDAALKLHRRSMQPFGGVQLLMIGDLAQLAPIVKDDDRDLLGKYYTSPYFFESHALKSTPHVSIELKQVYRQRDPMFLDMLEKIRQGHINTATLEQINARFMPNFNPKDDEGYIRLTTHNRQADAYNESRLAALRTPMYTYEALVDGDFPEQIFPVDQTLRLKQGAQVMFCKNDSSPDHRYYNGKVGRVVDISEKSITVSCSDGGSDIEVKPEMWKNSRYSLDPKTNEIVEEELGSFVQYPLRHAWAITIHKSQGLTFDRCMVDAAQAFATGQVYVALSRCRSLQGLVLSSRLSASAVRTDPSVEDFLFHQKKNAIELESNLPTLQLSYECRLIDELFDFSAIAGELRRITDTIEKHLYSMYPQLVSQLRDSGRDIEQRLIDVANKFHRQYQQLLLSNSRDMLSERIRKGCQYYIETFRSIIAPVLTKIDVESDSETVSQQLTDHRSALYMHIFVKMRLLKHFAETDFTTADFLHTKAMAAVEEPSLKEVKKHTSAEKTKKEKASRKKKDDTESTDIANPALFVQLRQWRNETATKEQKPIYIIANQRTLAAIAAALPTNMDELALIKGMGKTKVATYGHDIINIVKAYIDSIDEA